MTCCSCFGGARYWTVLLAFIFECGEVLAADCLRKLKQRIKDTFAIINNSDCLGLL